MTLRIVPSARRHSLVALLIGAAGFGAGMQPIFSHLNREEASPQLVAVAREMLAATLQARQSQASVSATTQESLPSPVLPASEAAEAAVAPSSPASANLIPATTPISSVATINLSTASAASPLARRTQAAQTRPQETPETTREARPAAPPKVSPRPLPSTAAASTVATPAGTSPIAPPPVAQRWGNPDAEEGVTSQQSNVIRISSSGVKMRSGAEIRIGGRFASGEVLLMTDPKRSLIQTDHRRIIVLDLPTD